MRKQTKIAAVVSAAALLALGASITSFAAVKGTWQMGDDGEWYCYDKSGDLITEKFCVDNGKEFYVGESGTIVRSDWAEYEGDKYFARSNGEKVINDWRLVTPYDDEDGEEAWYYFGSTGKMITDKKYQIKGQTYHFDADGKMFTGWVNTDDGWVYYNKETGARLKNEWLLTTEPDDEDSENEYYYYIGSKGKYTTGKKSGISGQTYFFGADGKMLSGWVAEAATGSNVYEEIGGESPASIKAVHDDNRAVYFCGDSDDGHMKKNKWLKMCKPEEYNEADGDTDQYWYWLDNTGKVFVPNATAEAIKYSFEDAQLATASNTPINVEKKTMSSKTYYFNDEGQMVTCFVMIGSNMYYFGGSNDGVMKTGAQTIADDNEDNYKFYFETKGTNKGAGHSGVQNGKLYYAGMLIKAEDAKYEIIVLDGDWYIVNQSGSVQTNKGEYKEDGDNVFGTGVKFTYNTDKSIAGATKDGEVYEGPFLVYDAHYCVFK